jgi:2-polyprenyl-6-methoxyphenol hydroxylase-like FAD-dependent oxidoreductase
MSPSYDVIVVGARCAGSPTAMLLARQGFRVLMVDRATFPSDTVSTHVVQPLAAAALRRWGLLDRLIATGCPPIDTYSFNFGPIAIAGAPGTAEAPLAYCPRRTVLDKLLVDAAVEAGVELREGFLVEEIVQDGDRVVGVRGRSRGGETVTERATIVVGADGRSSRVAEAVRPECYHEKRPLLASYYSYWSGLPMFGRFETYIRPRRGAAVVETHDGLTLVIAGWPYAEFETNRQDIEGHFLKVVDLVPQLADRIRNAKRESKFSGAAVPNGFRQPFGPGWVLVGDAGYIKDPVTAQGIYNAWTDAERWAKALGTYLAGVRRFEDAMAEAQRDRDAAALPMYEFTCELAALEPPPPATQRLLAAIQGNRAAMDAFARMNAGTISPAQFFAPENIDRILAAAKAA